MPSTLPETFDRLITHFIDAPLIAIQYTAARVRTVRLSNERRCHVWMTTSMCLAICLAGCGKKTTTSNGSNGNTSNGSSESALSESALAESAASLTKLKSALAATENLETEQAGKLWSDLGKQFPDDPSVALNWAINSVLQVDSLTAVATDSVKTDEEKKAARVQLPAAIDQARSTVDRYKEISGDIVTGEWLASRVDAHEASLLRGSITKSLRKDLFKRLTAAIDGPSGEDPKAVILGGPLTDLLEKLSDPIDGLPKDLQSPAAASIRRLSDENEGNLFLALKALRFSIDQQNSLASNYVERTSQLAAAVEPTLATYTKPIGMTPKQLTDKIVESIKANDWAAADQSFVIWSNVLGPLEILRTDRRRSSPHPLDRLSFDTVRRLSAMNAKSNPVPEANAAPRFNQTFSVDGAKLVLPLDADLDLDVDLATVSQDNVLNLWQNNTGDWSEIASMNLDAPPKGLLAADLFMVDSSDSDRLKQTASGSADSQPDYSAAGRHDTLPGLLLYGDEGIKLVQVDTRGKTAKEKRLVLIEEETGLESLTNVSAVVTGDLEGDGDLDLVVASESKGLRVFINRGNRTFFEAIVGSNTTEPDDTIAAMTIADLDRDLDLDILALHSGSGRVSRLENLLHLQFRHDYLKQVPKVEMADGDAALSITVEDVDGNVGWDVITTSQKSSAVAFGNSADIGVWTVDRVETGKGFETKPVIADFDNDTYFEILSTSSAARLGPWGINVMPLDSDLPLGNSHPAVADLDSNGWVDVVSISDGKASIASNESGGDAHHVAVRFKGIADNAAASGRVNHYAIGSVLELRFGSYYRSRIVTGPSTHFGLNGFDSADSIRVIMPNGLTQSIRDPKIDSIVEEEQTLKGSCPYLYSWDGEKFAFVTDCLWAAPLGLQVASGVVQKDRPWEYLKIDGDFVRPVNGNRYELRLTEELWEVAYVDHIQLTAVDHPADVDVFTNEKVGPPTIARQRLYSFADEDLHPVTTAKDTTGKDVTQLLSESDERYVKGFDRRIRQGLCPPHWIDLDFGQPDQLNLSTDDQQSVYLVLRGWILPTDTSLNIQIDQNPELPSIEFPSVWVPDTESEGGWRNAIPFMGFPGGKTKTIVVDVTEHLLAGDPRLRVRTSAQIYWDSAALAIQTDPADVRTQPLELINAEVAFHGFSRRVKTAPTAPETYDYSSPDLKPKWPPLLGEVTRQGRCDDLLREWDDAMVVISGGDEIRMQFEVPENAPPKGWKRDFVLHCVGWDKDADLNTLTGQAIGPLPVRDMKSYPPTAESADLFETVRRKNASSLRRRQSFRAFWHRDNSPVPPFQTIPERG